ncbi:hypothetical protein HY250_04470 [Candidatus Azambacteria bacterium]|nr:hypothetical protein [Candidatus Azambacteria bacterium]
MEKRFREYLEVLEQLKEPNGDVTKGEIEIITDPDEIVRTEEIVRERYRKQRKDSGSETPRDEWATVGVIDEDQYLVHLRDAVKFPGKPGKEPILGTYIRLVYKNQLKGNLGISLFVVDRNRRIILNRAFRHSIRRWVMEAAGTIARDNEKTEETISRCINHELGMEPLLIRLLTTKGYVAERGLVGGLVPIYYVLVDPMEERQGSIIDPSVSGHVALTREEYESALLKGVHDFNGIPHIFNDGYTNAGFLLATLNGLV